MSMIHAAVLQARKMLLNLDDWLVKGVAEGKAKGFDPAVLLAARLVPDQYPLIRQIQASCDQAKFMAARLSGQEAPKHPDNEQTMDEARARIRTCVTYLDTYKPSHFEGAETRVIVLPWLEGKGLTGSDFLTELALPNFYFHLTTAYAVLRHNGVPLGKRDYIGRLTLRDPS